MVWSTGGKELKEKIRKQDREGLLRGWDGGDCGAR